MFTRISRGFAALALLVPLASAQNEAWVDPVAGFDAPSSGAQGSPYKTISYAAGHTASPARFWLQPGIYSEQDSGESFPIQLPPQVEVCSVVPRGAKVRRPLALPSPMPDTVFELRSLPAAGPPYAIFRGLNVFTAHRGLRVHVDANLDGLLILLDDVRWTAWRGVALTAQAGTAATVLVSESRISGLQEGVRAVSNDGCRIDVLVLASELTGSSLYPGIELLPNGPNALTTLLVENTVLHSMGAGLHSVPTGGARIETAFQGCVFEALGAFTAPQSTQLGGIIDAQVPGPLPLHRVANSIFVGNIVQQDMPQYDPARYELHANLVEQPSLIGIGGCFTGDPLFVDTDGGDYHLLPGSPAIDAGDPAFAGALDRDGDPRVNVLNGPGLPDVGLDETYERYVRFHPPDPAVGSDAQLRIDGVENTLFFLFIGTGTTGAPIGSGPALTGAFPYVFASGLVSPPGFADVPFAFPDDGGLVGLELFEQVVYLEGPTLGLAVSDNVYRHVVAP